MGGAATAWALHQEPLARRVVMIAPPVDLRDFTRQLGAMLTAIAVRPGARLSELAYQAVADQHGVAVAAAKQALFGLS